MLQWKENGFYPGRFIPEYRDGNTIYGGAWFRRRDDGRYELEHKDATDTYATQEEAARAGVAYYWPDKVKQPMTLHKPARKNAARRHVEHNGVTWTVNRHGVAFRYEPDPHFPGMQIMVFPEPYRYGTEIAAFAFSTDPTFKRCKCC